jgi:hypothetical protein
VKYIIFASIFDQNCYFNKYHAETPWMDIFTSKQIFNTIDSKLGQKWEHNEKN